MDNPLRAAQALGQSSWYDNIQRGLLASGELRGLVELGVTGVTSNPTIFEKAITGSNDYHGALAELARTGRDPASTFESIAIEDVQGAAGLLNDVYHRSHGRDGYVSLEVSPHLAHDTQATIAAAHRLFAALQRPNVMIKVPATPEGIPAIRSLISGGVNVNVTLVFSLGTYAQVMDAYLGGLESLVSKGKGPSSVASVASFFVSRVDTAVDKILEEQIAGGRDEMKGLLGTAAIANARRAYAQFKETFGSARFAALQAKGARVQRPLWASTSTKNPSYPDTLYVDALIGPDTVNTMSPATVTAVLDHGAAQSTLDGTLAEADASLAALTEAGVDLDQVTARLLAEGVAAFSHSYDAVLSAIQTKSSQLVTGYAV